MLGNLKKRRIALLIGATLFLGTSSPSAWAMSPVVRGFLYGGAYGIVGGTAMGLVSYPITGNVRSIFLGSSIGLYLGVVAGIYLATNPDDPGNPLRAGLVPPVQPVNDTITALNQRPPIVNFHLNVLEF